MFLIFGIRTTHRRHPTPFLDCAHCGRRSAQSLVKRATRFSLFFIPLFPVRRSTYYLQCVSCGATTFVPTREAVQIIAG